MKPALVDTDILSMYFGGNETVKTNFEKYIDRYGKVNLSIITYYEIVSGLKRIRELEIENWSKKEF